MEDYILTLIQYSLQKLDYFLMTEKQLFYPLLSVYFSLILGDLQKEKLQIVSIFRFGHKKRGLFQCPQHVLVDA